MIFVVGQKGEKMGRLLDEQEVFDVLTDYYHHRTEIQHIGLREALSRVPSAQPEYRLDEWCEECSEYDTEKHCCPRFNKVIRTTLGEMEQEREARKKGKWILHKSGSATCSECGFTFRNVDDDDSWNRYCRHCGARMVGVENGKTY